MADFEPHDSESQNSMYATIGNSNNVTPVYEEIAGNNPAMDDDDCLPVEEPLKLSDVDLSAVSTDHHDPTGQERYVTVGGASTYSAEDTQIYSEITEQQVDDLDYDQLLEEWRQNSFVGQKIRVFGGEPKNL